MSPRSLSGPGQGNTQRPPGPQAGDQLALQRAPALDSAPARGDRQARDRRRRDPGARACRQRGSGHAAPATAFAPYARTQASRLAHKPANLSFEQAAAVPVSALTALQAVRHGMVQAGQKVLIIGASGGVGTFAVQISKAFGAEITGVCSTAKTDLVRSVGADHVIDYTRGDFADGRHRYDVILDIGRGNGLAHLRRALAPRGRLVMVGSEAGGRWLGGMDRLLRAHLLFPLVSQQLSTFIASENSPDLRVLRDLIESGKIAPAIDRTYPLSQTPAAIRHVQNSRARGKVVLTIWRVACQPTLRGERPLLPL